jgi:hypothetical protein
MFTKQIVKPLLKRLGARLDVLQIARVQKLFAEGSAELSGRREFLDRLGKLTLVSAASVAVSRTAYSEESAPVKPSGSLRVQISDSDSGHGVFARCYLTDSANNSLSPPGAVQYVKPPENNFISTGEFKLDLPPGTYSLTVERGPEYRAVKRRIEIHSGQTHEERIEVPHWLQMNARGWYSGDMHNHRDLNEMPELLLANDLNLAPTLTQWIWNDHPHSSAPILPPGTDVVRYVDATHVYSVVDTEIERLREGPGAVDLVGLRFPLAFDGYSVSPPNSVFTEMAHSQGGYVDAEKITWRDTAALVALEQVDFVGIVHNHFNRHGVVPAPDELGMIPKEKPEYSTPQGMAFWAMDVYYRFLNCGFRLPVSAGSASGVMPSPLGFNRVYVHLSGRFDYNEWFRGLKAGRSFATNGPLLFLTVQGREPGDTIVLPTTGAERTHLKVHAEVYSAGEIDRLEIAWKGEIIKSVRATTQTDTLVVDFEAKAEGTGWIAARAFERQSEAVRFAHTSPVYVEVPGDRGVVREDAEFFLRWIDRETSYFKNLPTFRSQADRESMLALFYRARRIYEELAGP